MIDTTITIGNVAIHEPVTVLTDCIITAFCFYFYIQLRKLNKDIVIDNWSIFFGLLGISTLFGAASHGVFLIHEGVGYKTIWLPMQVINGIAIYFAQQATINSVLKNSKHINRWKKSYLIQFVIFVIALMIFQKYLVTIIENFIGLLPIMILHLKAKDNYNKKIGYGFLVSFLTATVSISKFTLHAYFNYNDLAHVLIMISIFIIYIGIKSKVIS